MSRGSSLLLASTIITALVTPLHADSRSVDFTRQWTRNHPFFICAVHYDYDVFDMNEYLDANLNLFLPYGPHVIDRLRTDRQNVPLWIAASRYELTPEIIDYLQALAGFPGITGWYVYDEPNRQIFEGVGQVAGWLEEQYPDNATFSVLFPNYATATQLWGDDTNPDYTYIEYVQDYVNIIEPDFVAYDFYPFRDINHPYYTNLHPQYYNNLMIVRHAAQSVGKPYLSAVQAYANGQNQQGMRIPSESDLRLQTFSYLASGYDALGYFTYNYVGSGAMMDVDGNPTDLYYRVQEVNVELAILGYVMRFLTSTDFRFLPGQDSSQPNPTPEGLIDWTPRAGGDTHIQNIGVDLSNPANQGEFKNGLIGFFNDDNGEAYFMLVNAYHLAYTTSADTALDFVVDFDQSVSELLMLNRLTGQEEIVPLTDNTLSVTLPGGTGNLYKYNTGNGFPPGPRPTAAPVITQHPQPATFTPDGTAQLTVAANGDGTFMYQWQKDGNRLGFTHQYTGSRLPTLTISHADPDVIGDYTCIVTNQAGSTISNAAAINLTGTIAHDTFTNSSPLRDAGDPLVGTNTEAGNFTWAGNSGAVFSDNGYITNTENTGPRGSIPFTPNPSGDPIQAQLYLNMVPDIGDCWISIGLMSGTGTVWDDGELWMLARRDGRYTVFAYRTQNNLAQGQINIADENAY
ncbi:MAG: immunoglobulin domain-containing protein, partial [Planctomycetota bacterium]